MRKTIIAIVWASLPLVILGCQGEEETRPGPPNVILILADDQSMGSLGI